MSGFQFNPRPEVTTKVDVKTPTVNGLETQSFEARFLVLPSEERKALMEDPKEALQVIWLGWDGIQDIDKKPIPFSERVRRDFLEYDYIVMAVSQAYSRVTMGIEAKN